MFLYYISGVYLHLCQRPRNKSHRGSWPPRLDLVCSWGVRLFRILISSGSEPIESPESSEGSFMSDSGQALAFKGKMEYLGMEVEVKKI